MIFKLLQTLNEAVVVPYTERPSSDMPYEQFYKVLTTKADMAFTEYLNDSVLYRGVRRDIITGQYDPSTGVRKSEDMSTNFYTLILDSNPENSKYPKRSNSFICSNRIGTARSYASSDDHVAIVFPFDDVVLGVCPTSDIWHVANPVQLTYEEFSMKQCNRLIDVMCDVMGVSIDSYSSFKTALGDINIEQLTKVLNEIPVIFRESVSLINMSDEEIEETTDGEYDKVEAFVSSLKNAWLGLYHYNRTGFTTIKSSQLDSVDRDSEIWFSGKCLITNEDYMDGFMEWMKENHPDEL